MKNILILADGDTAKYFIEWISRRRISENSYHIVFYRDGVLPPNINRDITAHFFDPTSYSKLLKLMTSVRFSELFIVMDSFQDAQYSLKNVREINDKIFIVMLDKWNRECHNMRNLTIINERQLIASHIYDHLPNVPIIAQNIGLGEGEIMEMLVPFGSSYSYRHIGSIAQRKWKIVAIYRDKKQIIPTNATMVRPNDILLTLGKPLVLDGVYKSINKRTGLFPEPFGTNIYLILDMSLDEDKALEYIEESLYLLKRLKDKHLFVRVVNPSHFNVISKLKEKERERVSIHIYYDTIEIKELIEYDIQSFNIGLVVNSIKTFRRYSFEKELFNLKKLVYIFGKTSIYNITESVIMMSSEAQMESISSTSFDLADSFNFKLKLCNFSPNADFEKTESIISHYETLSQIFNHDITVVQKIENPIRRLKQMENVLQIIPFTDDMERPNIFTILSTRLEDYFLKIEEHPKILVPIEVSEVGSF